ncbi:hypothetical protein [Roseococcus thiosulfatophilus]|uniref:hypothetical protein n=1 Tax=Roseococcus thiosulfatophilus TaxID=35813 RepID=UPI001A906345|nr:hypothetical protein [Roseococcus thiosulfatophilus]
MALTEADNLALANEALALLGETSITAFTEGTELANSCARLVPAGAEHCLAIHPWRCTLAKARLVRLVSAPLTVWRYAYQLPGDVMVLRGALQTEGPGAARLEQYEIQGETLLADAEAVWIDYQRAAPPVLWSPPLRRFVVHHLASELAIPVTNSGSLRQQMHTAAYGNPGELAQGGLLAKARQADGQQQPPGRIPDAVLVAARFQGSRIR